MNVVIDPWPRMMTQAEAARYCGVSVKTFKRLCPVKQTTLGDGIAKFDKHALDRWIDTLGGGSAQNEPERVDYIAKAREALEAKGIARVSR